MAVQGGVYNVQNFSDLIVRKSLVVYVIICSLTSTLWSVVIIHYNMIIAIIVHHIIETCTSMNSVHSNQIVKKYLYIWFWFQYLQYIHAFGNPMSVMTDTAYFIHIS